MLERTSISDRFSPEAALALGDDLFYSKCVDDLFAETFTEADNSQSEFLNPSLFDSTIDPSLPFDDSYLSSENIEDILSASPSTNPFVDFEKGVVVTI